MSSESPAKERSAKSASGVIARSPLRRSTARKTASSPSPDDEGCNDAAGRATLRHRDQPPDQGEKARRREPCAEPIERRALAALGPALPHRALATTKA